jgi:MoCo/4Fe-4S cofactor protein with predicted Tat translocation signal
MSSLERSDTTRDYWRSLNDLENTPEFAEMVAKEFPDGPGPEQKWSESTRRRFLQIMGASVALGSVSSCRWQKGYIAPMADRPEGWVPGKPRHYSTCVEVDGVAQSLVVTSYSGRPTKVEGNQQSPASLGATTSQAQAGTLELCDPDRSRGPARFTGGIESATTWAEFQNFLKEQVRPKMNSGAGLAVLAPLSSSPSMAAQRQRFASTFPNASFVEFEATNRLGEQQGLSQLFGERVRPEYRLGAADIILALDEDFLGGHPDQLRLSREFAARRKPEEGDMNRLYAVEARFTLTGAAADHRLPVRAEQVGAIFAAIQKELAEKHQVGTAPSGVPVGGILAEGKVHAFIATVAKDLAAHKGKCLIAPGPSQSAEVHAQAHALNLALGNRPATVEYLSTDIFETDVLHASNPADLADLVQAMNDGKIDTLAILGCNPVYSAPADLNFAAALAKVPNKVHLGLYRDETATLCDWHLPQAHWLETWSDALAWDGTWTIGQPLIEPLYHGKNNFEFLGMLVGRGVIEGAAYVRDTFRNEFGENEAEWRQTVQRGFHDDSRLPEAEQASGEATAIVVTEQQVAPWKAGDDLEAVFHSDYSLLDGQYANLGWLQELPDPLTKLTWDNAAVVSPATAQALGVKDHDKVELDLDGRLLEMAIYVMPGQALGTVGLALGYGRTGAGHVAGLGADAVEPVGFNTYKLRSQAKANFGSGLKVRPTGAFYQLASTQDHYIIDQRGMAERGRRVEELVRGADLDTWKEHPDFAQHMVHHPPLKSLWDDFEYTNGYRWGMSIDLSSCTGCSSCTIACQAENNIPVVGKEQVFLGREMAWIRMDRYFGGDVEDPQIQNQPVGCMHCELAPCEQVCPVAATTHSSEGLNDMVYNRCIGTRYCANNCPYKVRRFNYFEFNSQVRAEGNEVLKMAMNPEVTVRDRGVMEKCSYCVQRIQTARVEAHSKGKRIEDGQVTPACAQVCPSDAIAFGDLNDKSSKVRRLHDNDRAYAVLAELNNKPRTAFLAAIHNPHPDLAPASDGSHAATEEVQHG